MVSQTLHNVQVVYTMPTTVTSMNGGVSRGKGGKRMEENTKNFFVVTHK